MSEKLFGDANWGESFCDALKDRQPKPLRWRTGPVPDRGVRYLIMETTIPKGYIRAVTGWSVEETDKWLPISDILVLIGGE